MFAEHQANAGDPFAMVSNALKLGDDVNGGDDIPEVGGHRLLGGDQVDRVILNVKAAAVDLIICLYHLAGETEVAAAQGLHRLANGLLGAAAEIDHVTAEVCKVMLELCPHGSHVHPPATQTGR